MAEPTRLIRLADDLRDMRTRQDCILSWVKSSEIEEELRTADQEIARLNEENDIHKRCALVNAEAMEKAEAALAQMRRMVEEPSEDVLKAVISSVWPACYCDDLPGQIRETIAALARHFNATEGK